MKMRINLYCLSPLFIFSSLSLAYPGGSGTKEDPYQISTCSELQSINGLPTASFKLISDIKCYGFDYGDGGGFMPIGSSSGYAFTGTLDGSNFIIYNLHIYRPDRNNVGLIGYLGLEGTVKNLTLVASSVTGHTYTGGIIGYGFGTGNSSQGTITNISYEGDVKGSGYVGGVMGYSYWRGISNSRANINVTTSSGDAGGLVGYSSNADIINSHATGVVRSTHSMGEWLGGLVGFYGGSERRFERNFADCAVYGYRSVGGLIGQASVSNVVNSYARGEVHGDTNVGGLIGYSARTSNTVLNSFAAVKVTGVTYTGGLIGYNFDNSVVTNSYWDKEYSGQAFSAGGTPKTTTEMYQKATYVNWDFDNIWMIDEVVNYPHFIN